MLGGPVLCHPPRLQLQRHDEAVCGALLGGCSGRRGAGISTGTLTLTRTRCAKDFLPTAHRDLHGGVDHPFEAVRWRPARLLDVQHLHTRVGSAEGCAMLHGGLAVRRARKASVGQAAVGMSGRNGILGKQPL